MSNVHRVKYPQGVMGLVAVDPGDGRVLWSVRWPVRMRVSDPPAKRWPEQRFRNGKADTWEAALEAMDDAARAGRPALEPLTVVE